MAFLGLLALGGKLLAKKLAHKHKSGGAPPSGLTSGEEGDLGFDNAPGPVPPSGGDQGIPNVPQLRSGALGVIQTSPTRVSRAKCPRGYSFISYGPPGVFSMNGTCVLTKVARALGLVHRRRGRGISARDLRAAVRVTRLVKHIEKMLPSKHHATQRFLPAPRAPGVRIVKAG